MAQMKVTGQVVDETGEPLIAVSVLEKGTTNGTVTDFDGNFSLSTKQNAVLVFSYVGYKTQELKATANMKVVLVEDSEILEDLVVVGYGVQKKSSVTGAISQVKAEDMQHRTISNAQSALQGKTAGVQVISTGAGPGSSPTIRVRGYSSNASSDPLYVVDGIRLSSISTLDPNDIESMEVLKDAASAAIYGAEAGNGVVLITTKRGKVGQGKVTYEFQYASQHLNKTPQVLNGEEYITYMVEGGAQTEEYLRNYWSYAGSKTTDWVKETFEGSQMMKHSLSLNGGSDRGSYYISMGYMDDNGIVKGNADYYKRLTTTVNADYKIKDWLKISSSNTIGKWNSRAVSTNSEYGGLTIAVLQMDPLTAPIYSPDKLPANMQNALAQGKSLLKDADGNYYGASALITQESYNPLINRDRSLTKNSGFAVNGNIAADLTPIKNFTFTSRLGYRLSGLRNNAPSIPYYGNATQNTDYVTLSSRSTTNIYYQWENFANYMKTFSEAHTVSGMLGISFQEETTDFVSGSLSANGENALIKNDPLFYYLNYAASSATKNNGGDKTRSSKFSYFGRIGYDYKGKYMIQASLRADAADLSILPLDTRWGYFPAVSAGWTISEENFWEPIKDVFNSMKFRASWGQNGSLSALGGYMYSSDITTNMGYNYIAGSFPSTMGNDKLKWETSEQLNFGLDGRLLRDRLTFGIDYFSKKTKDLLVNGTTPSLVIGGTTPWVNAGNVSNNGFEFELCWRDQVNKDFSYSIRANLATLTNKVTYLDRSLSRIPGTDNHNQYLTYFEEGYPVYYFRGFKSAGVNPENGNPLFYDSTGAVTENPDDSAMGYVGDALPDFTYGITLNATWKNFDLTVFGTGSQGNQIYMALTRGDTFVYNHLKLFYDDRWTPSNTSGSMPRANCFNIDKYLGSDAMVYDASFFKIKQIQIGYNMPKNWLKKTFLSNMRLYCSLDDFFTFTKYPGFDPEVASSATSGMGVDKGGYPSAKKFVLGVNVEF